jgi:hypothetical protein
VLPEEARVVEVLAQDDLAPLARDDVKVDPAEIVQSQARDGCEALRVRGSGRGGELAILLMIHHGERERRRCACDGLTDSLLDLCRNDRSGLGCEENQGMRAIGHF